MDPTRPRRLFVAGATGATGKVLVRLATARGLPIVPHARPARAARGEAPAGAAIFELGDRPRLVEALRGCTTVLQLIGTVRARFGQGDTYETSDIGTTRELVDAALEAGIDHFVLLSSVGAGLKLGAYLEAKARAEALVRESGIPFTLARPSMLVGAGRRAPPLFTGLTRLLGLRSLEPITLEQLSQLLLDVAMGRAALGEILEGESLWRWVAKPA